MKYVLLTRLIAAVAILSLAGCGLLDSDQSGSVQLTLSHGVDDKALVFNLLDYTNAAGNRYQVETLKYYVSDIRIRTQDSEDITLRTVHYVDATDESTLEILAENIPVGPYTELVFEFGLDEDKNVTGFLDNTLENENMLWPTPLGEGYHYMKLEGKYQTSNEDLTGYNTHTGRPRIDGVDHHHFFEVVLPISLTVSEDSVAALEIKMDINQWYVDPNTYNFEDVGPMIMGNILLQTQLKENGATVFSIP